jgi:hypothetical protein
MSSPALTNLPWVEAATALGDDSRQIHHTKLSVAQLLRPQLAPTLTTGLDVAERYLGGRAGEAELREARQDTWAFVTGMACGVTPSDSGAAHVVLTCLEARPEAHTRASLIEEVERLVRLGVPETALLEALLARRSPPQPA